MRNLIVALAATALIAVPATAQTSPDVFAIARTTCPLMFSNNDSTVVDRAITRHGLTLRQGITLREYCIMFGEGRVNGLQTARAIYSR